MSPERFARAAADALLRDWGNKIAALFLAAILFVITRNEVTRTFQVALRVDPDPNRVLMTPLPETIQAELRGPWARINRLQTHDIGVVAVRLEEMKPGPLEIDPGSVVMPSGVVLGQLIYDRVDLRFEPIVERDLPVVASIAGEPDADYELVRTAVAPPKWTIRGGRSRVQAVRELGTESMDISGATDDVEQQVSLMPPPDGVRMLGASDTEMPRVMVRAVITPLSGERSLTAPVEPGPDLPPELELAPLSVSVQGPLRALRRLEALGLAQSVRGHAVPVDDAPDRLEVRLRWDTAVPEDLRAVLNLDPTEVTIARPAQGE